MKNEYKIISISVEGRDIKNNSFILTIEYTKNGHYIKDSIICSDVNTDKEKMLFSNGVDIDSNGLEFGNAALECITKYLRNKNTEYLIKLNKSNG